MGKELVIPDLHLWHFNARRDTPRLTFLHERIADPAIDRVILLGDVWDNLLIDWRHFVHSGWSELFPALKQKNTVYIKGNHDARVPRSPKRFWDELISAQFTINGGNYQITLMHGHKLDSHKHLDKIAELKAARFLYPLAIRFQEHALARGAASRTWQLYKTWNQEQKSRIAEFRKPQEIVITGHTHLAEEDISNGYINAGAIDTHLRRTSYVVIDDMKPALIRHYVPDPRER